MPNELNMRSVKVAAEIRAEMARQKVSVNTLSEAVGIPLSTLRRSVNGTRSFTLDELHAVGEALGLRLSVLISRTGNHEEPAA